jgi:AcrR family transcriptional regulator
VTSEPGHLEPGPEGSLPPGLDLLWGRRARGRRGPKPVLSVDAIIDAAVHLADVEGLGAVSMARVAKQLGFTTMSLYRYIASKDELLQLMWNASAEGAEELVLSGDGWRPRLRMWAEVQRQILDRHPWITEMPMAAPPVAPNSLTFVERGLETMDQTGLSDPDKLRIIGLISSYTLSEARMAHDAVRALAEAQAQAGTQSDVPPPVALWDFHALLRELVDDQRYPRLYRIAWDSGSSADRDEHQEFGLGLETILDGVQVLIDRTSSAPHNAPGTPAAPGPQLPVPTHVDD